MVNPKASHDTRFDKNFKKQKLSRRNGRKRAYQASMQKKVDKVLLLLLENTEEVT